MKTKKTKPKDQEKGKLPESMITRGLVVSCSLPSRSILEEGIRKQEGEVRYAEIVELFPIDVYRQLETIRRYFYRKLEGMVYPAYSIKLLPFEELPKFKKVIEKTKAALVGLDAEVEKALKSAYHRKAKAYFKKTSNGHKPRTFTELSKRMQVTMMPLRLDPFVWEQFLTEEMKAQEQRMKAQYEQRKTELNESLAKTQADLETAKKDLERAEEDLNEKYEIQTIPLDLAQMKIEKKELEGKIKDLQFQERDLKRKINRLDTTQERNYNTRREAYVWARDQTEETEKAISFDIQKLWKDTLEDLVRQTLDALELDEKLQKKQLDKVLQIAQDTINRIYGVKPGSALIEKFERFVGIVGKALDGQDIAEELGGFY